MEESFLKERLERFLKVIPAEYKIADPMKKGPKGYTTTLERVPGATKTGPRPVIKTETEPEAATNKAAAPQKSKKKSLDEILEAGMI